MIVWAFIAVSVFFLWGLAGFLIMGLSSHHRTPRWHLIFTPPFAVAYYVFRFFARIGKWLTEDIS